MKLKFSWFMPLLLVFSMPLLANTLAQRSVQKYPVCDVSALAAQLTADSSQTFQVEEIADKQANYTYYLVINHGAMNADNIRRVTCQFIRQHQCHVFWGNVANIGMFAAKPAARFPGDTSTSYTLSPIINPCKTAK